MQILSSPLITDLLSQLPSVAPSTGASLSSMYGADYVAANYCGLKRPPSVMRGLWQHGWKPRHCNFDPDGVIGGYGSYENVKQKEFFWVARKDQEAYLQEHGYRRTKAIGLPIIYLPKNQLPRIKGSLLVMPVHSLEGVEKVH